MMDGNPSIYVSCMCGCEDVVHFVAAHGTLYASFLRSEFYSQQKPIRSALKERFNYVFRKKVELREILTSRATLETLRQFLSEVVYTEYDTTSNLGVISAEHVWGDVYALTLTGKVPKNWIWRGRMYRIFDLVLNSADRDQLVAAIDAALAEPVDENEHVTVIPAKPSADTDVEEVAKVEEAEEETEQTTEDPEESKE